MQLIRNEAQACQAVSSPHLLKLLLAEPRAEVPFLVFEWLEGRTLEEELRDVGPLTLRRAVWMARQTADGMQDLERCGLAHGDIKPQNIFITLGGEVKLLDLGFVRSIAAMPGPGAADTLLGTPEYLAPESLVSGVALPVAKDMYALGVTLYRMLTGRLPFVGDSPAELMVQHRQVKPTLLRRHRPDAPRALGPGWKDAGQTTLPPPPQPPQPDPCAGRYGDFAPDLRTRARRLIAATESAVTERGRGRHECVRSHLSPSSVHADGRGPGARGFSSGFPR